MIVEQSSLNFNFAPEEKPDVEEVNKVVKVDKVNEAEPQVVVGADEAEEIREINFT